MERSVLEPIDHYAHVEWPATLQRRQIAMIDLLSPVVARRGGRVLDVGCGDGFFLAKLDERTGLTSRGWELHGVDFSPAALEAARRLPYTFERCNLEDAIPYPDDSFDVLTAGEVIEHVYDPDRLLREARRVLRPGGSLVLTTPNIQAWYNRLLFLAGIQPVFYETSTKTSNIGAGPLARFKRSPDAVGHVRVFNRRALVDLLDSEGFSVAAVRGAPFDFLPGPMQPIDRRFNAITTLASNLVVLATAR